jgi:hypothetical protein
MILASGVFAAAAIGSHGHFWRLLTGTTTTGTTLTSTTPGQRKVIVCHRTHSRKHPEHSIVISQWALSAHLRHGDHLGACVVVTLPPTTTATTPTVTTRPFHGHGDNDGDDDDQGGNQGNGWGGHGNAGSFGSSTLSSSGHGHGTSGRGHDDA